MEASACQAGATGLSQRVLCCCCPPTQVFVRSQPSCSPGANCAAFLQTRHGSLERTAAGCLSGDASAERLAARIVNHVDSNDEARARYLSGYACRLPVMERCGMQSTRPWSWTCVWRTAGARSRRRRLTRTSWP